MKREFPQESIEELARDIQARGLLQPVLLNPDGGRFQLIAGERRLRAIKFNGAAAIPALLVKASADEAMLMQLAENIRREDLSLEEECEAIAKLYKMLEPGAETVKKSKPWCSKRYAMTQTELHSKTASGRRPHRGYRIIKGSVQPGKSYRLERKQQMGSKNRERRSRTQRSPRSVETGQGKSQAGENRQPGKARLACETDRTSPSSALGT